MNILLAQAIAQVINNPALGPLGNMSPTLFLGNLIRALISLGIVIGAIVFVFSFILGGISWISSGGDKMKIEQARSKITTALVGLVVLLSFFAILNLAECFFGIGLREITVGPFDISFTSSLNCGGSTGGETCTPLGGICGSGEPPCCPGEGACIGGRCTL